MLKRIQDSANLAVIAVSTANNFSTEKSKSLIVGFVVFISLIWTVFVLMGFTFFGRVATVSGERFRLSLGFSLASLVFPFFAIVPTVLNVH